MAATKLIGYDSVLADTASFSGYAVWARFICLESGVVTSLKIYMGTAGTYLRLALYSDNAGAPATVLAQGTGTGTGWVSQVISQGVVKDTYYHLAAVSDGVTRYVASGGDREYKAAWGNNAFTDNPTGTTPDAILISIYGDGEICIPFVRYYPHILAH